MATLTFPHREAVQATAAHDNGAPAEPDSSRRDPRRHAQNAPNLFSTRRYVTLRLYCPVLGGPRPAALPSELHARRAARTRGELLSMLAGALSSPVVGFGSGKLVTP
jgi:hypothetical protein